MKGKGLKFLVCTAAAVMMTAGIAMAKENIGVQKNKGAQLRTAAGCAPSSSSVELDVNNVRCLLHNGGDFWWDLQANPRYEVPKVTNAADKRHSSFAGSLWIGGLDEAGQLRVAAQTYRQSGYDFWPGPLVDGTATIDEATCEKWDKHFVITKTEIGEYRAAFLAAQAGGPPVDLSQFPGVKNWPAFGEDSDGNRVTLAPFVDVDGDPFSYTPDAGDYPNISPVNGGGEPDQAIWWVINDKGDVHTETGGEAIGVEIHMLAFAFTTANAINDMTFYKYTVINRSTLKLNDTYMGQWVDSDVGNYQDDYVGCDTTRGLGFAYNGDANDEGATGYGLNPPAFGLDFFQGPFGDNGFRLPMQRFVYYENDFSLRGNPEVATHFYGYLIGKWKDGSDMVNNGTNGYGSGPVTNFIYPGDPGFCGGPSIGWNEVSAGNQPFDRRFLQSAGPFTLQPGAVNDIIVGAVWARRDGNANLGSVCALKEADDIAQALFDNNFRLLDGPDAPEVAIGEYDQELVITWNYGELSIGVRNNVNESYLQDDPILVSEGAPDPTFEFEGYMVFQLKDNTVSASELFDTEKARLVTQCDKKNNIATIVNRTTTLIAGLPDPVIVDQVMVQGENEGIFNSVRVTEDEFASGSDRRLKNYTTYYYAVIAYAYNDTSSDGKKFVQGNNFFANTPAMPHKIDFENFGTTINSEYGDGIEITQIAGVGNGGHFVKVTEETESSILSNFFEPNITYKAGYAPIDVKVVNPKEVKGSDYQVDVVGKLFTSETQVEYDSTALAWLIDSTFAEWILYEGTNEVYRSTYIQRSLAGTVISTRPEPLAGTERVIPGHGFSIAVRDVEAAGDTVAPAGLIGDEIVFDDPLFSWLSGVPDDDAFPIWDWLLSGEDDGDRGVQFNTLKPQKIYDKTETYEGLAGGSWAPFCLARASSNGDGDINPGVDIRPANNVAWIQPDQVVSLDELPDVDIVFTADKSKWSRCVVVETAPAQNLGSGAWPLAARWEKPIEDINTYTIDQSLTLSEANQGMSWFPGYAINVNTGERLNIFFGESSWDKQNNGDDMRWNPTADFGSGGDRIGGRHYVYVMRTRYDECQTIRDFLTNTNFTPTAGGGSALFLNTGNATTDMRNVYKDVAWVGVPMLNGAFTFDDPSNIPTNTRVSLRVNQTYRSRTATTDRPVFTFSTRDIAAATGVKDVASKSLMEQVRVVPNPYYAYSRYESSQIQTICKITNLPQKCKIRIYTLNGTLIRTYNKDSDSPEQVWDLKNHAGVPIASGVYLIHVDGEDLGETILKFFAVMPKIDLNSF